MAITITDVARGINNQGFDGLSWRTATVLLDSSYPTGGEALTAANLGLTTLLVVVPSCPAGYVAEYDYANSKLLMYRQKDPAAAGGADIPLPEVGNTISLATVTVRIFAIGTV